MGLVGQDSLCGSLGAVLGIAGPCVLSGPSLSAIDFLHMAAMNGGLDCRFALWLGAGMLVGLSCGLLGVGAWVCGVKFS